jgi:tryptophanase
VGAGDTVIDLPHPSAARTTSEAPFKGDIDLTALGRVLAENRGRVPLVILTLTNNAGGGQPLAPANAAAAAELCRSEGVQLWIDAARYAENAALICARDPASRGLTPRRVAATIFSHADGVMMSCKKDGLAHVGGFVALRDRALFDRLGAIGIATEGYVTYGGLSGRDLEAIAVGLEEALDPAYLAHRLGQVQRLHGQLAAAGIPVVSPPGGHAVFVDAGALLPHVPPARLPGQALACELYVEAGVRACEIGTLMFGGGRSPHVGAPELVRLAIPRRVYETAHLDHVAEALVAIARHAARLPGYEIVEGDGPLRHFTARLRPVPLPVLAVAS